MLRFGLDTNYSRIGLSFAMRFLSVPFLKSIEKICEIYVFLNLNRIHNNCDVLISCISVDEYLYS